MNDTKKEVTESKEIKQIKSSNKNLLVAKINKNDEFYTRYEDIENELKNYKRYFKNKIVYCPCDCFYQDLNCSNFFKYFRDNFFELELEKLICSFYLKDGYGETIEIEAVYPQNNSNKKPYLVCNVSSVKWPSEESFENYECIELIKKSDVIVTNPPFSKFRNLFGLCIKNKKKFLFIANKNVLIFKDVFPLFMKSKVRLGLNDVTSFLTPNGDIQKFGNIGWITNLKNDRSNKMLELTERYYDYYDENHINLENKENKYPTYLNYNAINVDKSKNIPVDYEGIMGVPLSFLDKYNPKQFEIIGAGINAFNESLDIGKIGKEVLKKYKNQGGTGHYTENMHDLVYEKDGKIYFPYKRVLIKKRN